MRLPRKLKKGIRTMNGRPRNKWQRRGQILTVRLLFAAGRLAAAIAKAESLRRIPNKFPPGGIVTDIPHYINQGEKVIGNPRKDYESIVSIITNNETI